MTTLTHQTRLEAFEQVQPRMAGQDQLVLEALWQHGSLTAWQIMEITGMELITSVRRALFDLEEKKKIHACGTAMGRAGVKCTLYRLNEIEAPIYWDDRGQGVFFNAPDVHTDNT